MKKHKIAIAVGSIALSVSMLLGGTIFTAKQKEQIKEEPSAQMQ